MPTTIKEYHKIKGIYKFDEKTHLPIQEIDLYFSPLKNLNWIFTEKIDGTNIRVVWDGHKVEFYGRTDNAQIPAKLFSKLRELFMEEIFEQVFGEQPVTLYGEGYGGKIQHGIRDYKEQEDFILFDVEINEVFLERPNMLDIADKLGLSCVPIVLEGTLEDGINRVKNNCLGKHKNEKQIEGIVGVPEGGYRDRLKNRIIVKIKQEHFIF